MSRHDILPNSGEKPQCLHCLFAQRLEKEAHPTIRHSVAYLSKNAYLISMLQAKTEISF
jgi:hypothetical protein